MEEWKKVTLVERLLVLIEGSDAALALPGGPGTLAEVSLTWNLMIVGSLSHRPLILIGEGWRRVLIFSNEQLGPYIRLISEGFCGSRRPRWPQSRCFPSGRSSRTARAQPESIAGMPPPDPYRDKVTHGRRQTSQPQ